MNKKNDLNKKIKNATKWSSITEIIAKLISPITNMILARLLAPEAFGIVATVTMVFSFADMFADAGFQKFLVQHEFKDKKNDKSELFKYANVAFWSNFIVSIIFWIIITIFAEKIAKIVGCEGLGNAFIISCISLPLTAFSSIQMAIYRRKFDFKTLFKVRIIGVLLPLIVTVPIAFFTHSYWALIIGTICGNLSNAIILTIKSEWKPKLYFKIGILKEMLSFSLWSLMEAISIWLTNYIGVFIVGSFLSTYYLGIYKTSMSTVNQFTTIITSATTPVLFAALSRMQEDRKEFEKTFFKFQRLTSFLVIPLGIGLFLYRDLVTDILLGSQWKEATGFVGLWALVSCVKIIYSNYCYEVYRAFAKPKVAVIAQICQLVVLVPAIYITAKIGFKELYIARSLVTLELIIVNQILMKVVCKFSILDMFKNTYFAYIACVPMIGIAIVMKNFSTNVVWSFFSIFVCMLIYFVSLYVMFPSQRSELKNYIQNVKKEISKIGGKQFEKSN